MLSVSWTRCTIRWRVSVRMPRMQIQHRREEEFACVGAGFGEIPHQGTPAAPPAVISRRSPCRPSARRLLDASREYVVHGRQVPSSWVWRKLTRRPA
jgi:hypothetical protein